MHRMNAFEFFFSFYGLVLGLSVAAIATGAARAFKHRKTVAIGWKTPMLAVFAALDITTFWDAAWTNFSGAPYSYGLLVAGLVVAAVYFIAANLIFPEEGDAVQNLDAHFWTNKRAVLLLLMLANLFMGIATIVFDTPKGGLALTLAAYATILVYPILVLPAALTRRAWLFALTMGLHIALYLCLAGLSLMHPELAPATAVGAA
mgnify:CR=1 FL=1